jgi:hypothetical protein
LLFKESQEWFSIFVAQITPVIVGRCHSVLMLCVPEPCAVPATFPLSAFALFPTLQVFSVHSGRPTFFPYAFLQTKRPPLWPFSQEYLLLNLTLQHLSKDKKNLTPRIQARRDSGLATAESIASLP